MRSLRGDFLNFQWDGSKRNIEQARAVKRSHIAKILHSAKVTISLLLR